MTIQQFKIGNGHLDVIQSGEAVRIKNRKVEGVTTRLLGPQNLMDLNQRCRTVSIEYRDENGQLRNLMIERQASERTNDDLLDYARRVASHAAENALKELAAQDIVERNGFMISDSAIVLTANGETLCCGLFDLQSIERVGDRTIVWIADNAEASATINQDDPNALTLGQLLPRLVTAEESVFTRLIGQIDCDPYNSGNRKLVQSIALVVAIVAGLGAAITTSAIMNQRGPQQLFPLLLGMIPLSIPLMLLVGWRGFRKLPKLTVLRHGICIQEGDAQSEYGWNEIKSMHLTHQEVNIGGSRSTHYVCIYTLHLNIATEQGFQKELKLSWQKKKDNELCKDYLREKLWEISEGAAAKPKPAVASQELAVC